MQRRLMVDSIENIRDLGGYSTANGKQTRWKSFLRADHFQAWTPETRQTLVDYGVKLVIDLRAPHELEQHPNSFSQSGQITYLNLPLLPDELDLSPRFRKLRDEMADNHEMYVFMLEESKSNVGSILTTMATHNTQTTLFHCFAGKDRTGIIAALLLSLADVDDASISTDYALTGDYLADRIANVVANADKFGADPARIALLFASTPHSILNTVQYLREKYGTIPNYLQTCGVSDTHINTLRTLMVEDTP
jgi:protein-tyrosine phosphatase